MTLKDCRILVTGGAGFIGSSLVKNLLIKGAVVYVIDNLWRGRIENLQFPKLTYDLSKCFIKADLIDYNICLKYIKNVDVVYHLADVVAGVDYVFDNEPYVFRQNILINTNVIWACVVNRIPNYIYVGTACSYPKNLQNLYDISALKEEDTFPAEPESGYGWAKLMGEYEAELIGKNNKINIGLLRLHNVYGPGVLYDIKTSQVLPSLVRKAILFPKEDFIIWGSGNQYRDFIYVDDVINALLLLLKKGMNQGLIQIGSEKAVTIHDAAKTILKISNKDINIKYDNTKPEGDRGRIAVCDRAKKILGWKPEVDFVEGIKKMYEWIELQINNSFNM